MNFTAFKKIGFSAVVLAASLSPMSNAMAAVPSAPTGVSAVAGSGQATVSFTAATAVSGSTITGYTASCKVGTGTALTKTGTSSPIIVTGLTNGSTYTCSVTTTYSTTTAASTTASVTPVATTVTVPGAPTIGTATAGNAQASISFTASTTGSAATSYTATCTTGTGTTAVSKTGTGTSSPITVSSLTNGTTYTCSVKASNAAGTSAASGTVSVTPVASTTLVAPSIKGVLPGDSRISVMFNFVGGKILGSGKGADAYVATCTSSDGGVTGTSTASAEYSSGATSNSKANYTNPLVVSGLTNGKSYTCKVTETLGTSSAVSGTSSAVIPNAGPPNSSGVLASTANTTHITAYSSYSKYCGYTNQTATGTGTVPTITYYSTTGSKTTGTSTASITCSGTSTRTLVGNALPDHRSSEWFTNGLAGYTGSPYFSGNPNSIGAKSVNKSVPYNGTISTGYSMGANGYDTSSCYAFTSSSSPGSSGSTYTSSSGAYRCTYVYYPAYANNSVKIEAGTAETYVSTTSPKTTYKVVGKNIYQDVGLDPSNAHNQPTMSGTTTAFYGYYHYHGMPEGHIARIGKGNSTMTLVAFAVDGFPIYARYGYTNRTSTGAVKIMKSNYRLRTAAELTAAGYTDRPSTALAPYGSFEQDWVFDSAAGGDLDACNGRYGVTPESPTTAVYHYFITDSYPFIQRCTFGVLPSGTWANSTSAN